jgi:hypothetical protein
LIKAFSKIPASLSCPYVEVFFTRKSARNSSIFFLSVIIPLFGQALTTGDARVKLRNLYPQL